MDIHKNARLTLRNREELVQQVAAGLTLKQAAARFNVTSKTAAKWVRRFRENDPFGLRDHPSRPKFSPRQISPQRVEQVIALRREFQPGYRIARALGLSCATVSRILQRERLSHWRNLHPRPPVVRYEHPHPGDLLHLDIKGMTCYQQVSVRGDGRLRGRPQFAGRAALHVAVDDHSRLAFSQMLPDQKSSTTVAFLQQATAFFGEHGIRIRSLLTDNGSCYRSQEFRRYCLELGMHHRFTRPYTPGTNGKAERFIQTALREWAYARAYQNSDQRSAELLEWLRRYNWHRPHGSLKANTPISRLGLSEDNLLRLHS